ncbi:ABC transporter permease [Sorangium sp. So ce260]|uniref:ABC transporter permease n=1 Tax=Sorangium sp. So ce260 TaxID=3133291 RepID=UPI003F5D804E
MKLLPQALVGRETAEAIAIPVGALAASLLVFGAFVAAQGASPLSVYYEMYRGAFGTWFSFQNTLLRAAPLMLTALCTALPARLGLIVIGGEGAVVVGGLAAASAALASRAWGAPPAAALAAMLLSGLAAGALWIGLAGALRVYRGVSETISSLLLNYIGIAILNHLVEGALRDPASLNKPSTAPIGAENALGNLPGVEVHWGLAYGVLACALCYVLMHRTTFGFAAAMSGGNVRAALLAGLPVRRLVVITCMLAGACAGLAGMVEVAAVHGRANASLISGYGYTGILVAFIARHHPLAIMPVALLLGGIGASGGLLQRTAQLPDATVSVLQGILFLAILASETLRGRPRAAREPRGRQAAPASAVA